MLTSLDFQFLGHTTGRNAPAKTLLGLLVTVTGFYDTALILAGHIG